MAAGDRHAALPQQLHELVRTFQLGRKRDMTHRSRSEQPLEQTTVGIAPRLGRMRPEPLRRDERALEMRADDVRRGTVQRHLVQRRRQLVFGRGDERRLVGGHAAREQRLARFAVALGVGREEVDACEPVDLQVDEPGSGDSVSVRRAHADACDATVNHVDVAGNQVPVDECCPDAESHA